MRAHDVRTGRRREVIEPAYWHPHANHPALGIGEADFRPDRVESRLILVGYVERSVVDGDLKIHRAPLSTRIDEPYLPVIVHRHAPRSGVRTGRLFQDPGRRPAESKGVVGGVDPVVEAPHETRLFVFEVAVAAEADPRVEMLALVGDAIVVRIRPLHEIVRRRFIGEDAVAVERYDRSRKNELVDEHRALVVDAVSLRAFEPGDTTLGRVLIVAVGIAHVGRELSDVHATVSVETDHGGIDDRRFGDDELHSITRRQDETLGLFFGRECPDGGLG